MSRTMKSLFRDQNTLKQLFYYYICQQLLNIFKDIPQYLKTNFPIF